MAFDQSTRNRLQKFVNDARNLLTEEFTRQLQATYGLDPKAGSVAAVDSLTQLDNRQRQTANVLRDTLAHYLATTHGKGEKDRTKQALSRIVREQAFTVLNRLAALRMAEARGFLLETIAKGYNAKGFQLYKQLAGSSLGETGEAYRNYLYSVFDEFSLDLAVLFDRHSAQGRLFPRESALLELLDLINHHEIEPLWAEDETIGWIYQYFNSQEERKKMRAESQAPRNSRELAVRNQFFTPRYVVEFLTDNTLGRIWYEMTQGKTSLFDSCRYLVRRSTEVFLKRGELAPEQEKAAGEAEALSQEELLKQPVYIPHRAIKDPRCIRMLDPACGSMHFGLYAFDLYERIYEEAWQLETELGAEAFVREGDLKPLHQTYESFGDFKVEIPRLIIEHNIHGVDIDPRAVQIAGLSLWQRAQRAWQQQGIKPQRRPVVRKSNIVCAEPMPGEKALLKEFSHSLNPPVLGQLLEAIFDKMELAGEAGTLLKIEEEIQSSIHQARGQWQTQSGSNSVGDMFPVELDQATPQKKFGFDLRGVDDESFWEGAEQLILDALSNYADKAASNADQKRLFAEDAAKGFAFIDLCRKSFDVVLMNPPFGQTGLASDSYIKQKYPTSYYDLGAAFIDRCLQLLDLKGKYGLISNRTIYFNSRLSNLRRRILSSSCPDYWVDLGSDVLDALVETSLLVATNESVARSFPLLSVSGSSYKDVLLSEKCNAIDKLAVVQELLSEKLSVFKPHASPLFEDKGELAENGFEVRQGLATGDNFSQLRLRWEIPADRVNVTWFVYSKGGEYAPYYYDPHLLIKWTSKSIDFYRGRTTVFSCLITKNSEDYLFRAGLTYPSRTSSKLSVRLHLEKSLFDTKGPVIFCNHENTEDELLSLAFVLNSNATQYQLDKETSASENAARTYGEGLISRLKIPLMAGLSVDDLVRSAINSYRNAYSLFETSSNFSGFCELSISSLDSRVTVALDDIKSSELALEDVSFLNGSSAKNEVDVGVFEIFGECIHDVTSELTRYDSAFALTSYVIGLSFKRWRKGEFTEERSSIFSPIAANAPAYLGAKATEVIEGDRLAELLRAELSEDVLSKVFGGLPSLDNGKYVLVYFKRHLSNYSMSRRQAPIYWPLQTQSGSYTLWLYYHQLTEQTLYTCVNDFVEPKLEQVEQDLAALRGKTARNSQEEKELEKLSDLASELRDFRDELLRIAKFWKPNLNDGVQITAAPLWKLFQHKAWQKKLKETWEKLEKGDYDWSHMACGIWPERVLRSCHQDRSLAIAHDVEDAFWHEVEVPVKRGKKATGETKLEWQPKTLTDDELDALIQAKIKEMRT